MNKYTSLFEQQSYSDALSYYTEVLAHGSNAIAWDYVILTAAGEAQAQGYREQIEWRRNQNQLPDTTHFAVLPDPEGKRVGSGGATFNVLRYIKNHAGTFSGKRILVIHSGGDSKRVPQYSACGKLFSPVPRMLPFGRRSTLFDEFLIGMSTVAPRIFEGMLVCSGDVLLLFNALQIDFYTQGAAALSIKEDVETGKNHGVYLNDGSGKVVSFLHKQTVETLTDMGAVDAGGRVDIDTGAVILSSGLLGELYTLIDSDEKFASFVNEDARISFYADFLYPLAMNSTLEQFYKEKPEGDYTEELHACRTAIWEVLHGYEMKLICLSPASFIHFGTTKELLKLMTQDMDNYRFLSWSENIGSNVSGKNYAVSGSYVSRNAAVGANSYIEDCYIHHGSEVGAGCVLSGITLSGDSVPENTVLHGLKLRDGRFTVRAYGVGDNPKECKLFGEDIGEPLWTYPIYPVCATIDEAVSATLSLVVGGEENTHGYEFISLKDSFALADVSAILPWQDKLSDKVDAETILGFIDDGISADTVAQRFPEIKGRTQNHLVHEAERLDEGDLAQFGRKIRIYYYLYKLTGRKDWLDRCFNIIRDSVVDSAAGKAEYNRDYRINADEHTVRLPVRVNWGGGWSDTPPYCMEHGGTVLNAAVSFGGVLPIEVTVKRLSRLEIILASTDIGSYKEFSDISELKDCTNPSDAFALHKAALIACGVIPMEDEISLEKLCQRLGGGLYINTRVINIPKGSGLGTSSILAGACVKALFEFFEVDISDSELYGRVLCMEQLMSTGGGWQDQVGGLAPGMKMITSRPGFDQKLVCTPLNIPKETFTEFDTRFALIYTGQRRLARNLLREVVGKYLGNNPDSVSVLYEIQQIAVLMRFELEKGNVDAFAELLNRHWELSKKLDSGCTNTCIDQIFLAIDDLIDGRMICGAGGGGFLQVIMKKGVTVEDLRLRLKAVFADSGVDVWDCKFE